MSTHKALVLSSFSDPITHKSLPTPTVVPGSVLVSPLYAPVQTYARAVFTGKLPYPLSLPLTPGASCIARVESVGADATLIKPGDVVWVDPTISARDNPDSQILLGFFGGATAGSKVLMDGVWRNGCYAEKALVPLESTFVLPPHLFLSEENGGLGYGFKDLVNMSHALVPFGGLESAGVGPGSTVIVSPATGDFSGGAVLVALAMGARVVAGSRNEAKMAALFDLPGAKERLGTVVFSGNVENDTEALLEATGGIGADAYLDLLPPVAGGSGTPTSITSCLMALKRGGQAILMGGVNSNIEIPYGIVMLRNLTVRGQFMYPPATVKKFIKLLEYGNLKLGRKVGIKVGTAFALEDIERALDEVERPGAGTVLLAPNGEH